MCFTLGKLCTPENLRNLEMPKWLLGILVKHVPHPETDIEINRAANNPGTMNVYSL